MPMLTSQKGREDSVSKGLRALVDSAKEQSNRGSVGIKMYKV